MPSKPPSSNPLSLTALTVEGADARSFLQAQLTADLAAVGDESFCPAAWCDPKGRVLAVMLVSQEADAARIVLPAALVDSVQARMNLFRIGRNVTISGGPAVAPSTEGVPLGWDRERRLSLEAFHPDIDWHDWLMDDVRAGLPWILPKTAGRFLPQMLGLERVGGLSYRKGCYPGQEVVARVHYRGRLTQRLARFELEGAAPDPGQSLELGAARGVVLFGIDDAATSGRCAGLMVVPADAQPVDAEGASADDAPIRWTIVDAEHAVLPSGA